MGSNTEEPLLAHLQEFEILKYLPHLGFSTPDQVAFLQYLVDIFNNNWCRKGESNLHQIAFKAFYDLYITFIFVKVWQIKEHMNSKFLTNFNNMNSPLKCKLINYLLNSNQKLYSSLFDISIIPEKQVFEFLRALEFHSNKIDQFSSYVVHRDHCSHPSGFVQYTETDLKNFMNEMIDICEKVVSKSMVFIERIFSQFLIDNYDLNDDPDIFDNGLIKPQLLSLKEIGRLCNYDIDSLRTHTDFDQIKSFFHGYINKYSDIIY